MARSKKKANVIKVDFTGVETSGNIKEGRQLLTVAECELKTSDSSGNDYLNFKLKGNGGNMYHTCSLMPQALFNLRGILEAMGQEVPEGPLEIDTDELIGESFGGEVEHETYQGKKKGVLVDVFPAEELDDDEEQAEEDDEEDEFDRDEAIAELAELKLKGLTKAKLKKLDDVELAELFDEHCGEAEEEDEAEEESDDIDWDTVQDADKDELLEMAEELEIKLKARDKKSEAKIRAAIIEALELEDPEEEGEEEPDEDDESEMTFDDIMAMDKDDLLQVAEDAEIKVPAKHKKTAKKLQAFLIEELGLEEEEEDEPAPKSKGKSKGGALKKGTEVTFDDDGDEMEGTIKSVNKSEGFAVIDVDGEDWEVELDDITVA